MIVFPLFLAIVAAALFTGAMGSDVRQLTYPKLTRVIATLNLFAALVVLTR